MKFFLGECFDNKLQDFCTYFDYLQMQQAKLCLCIFAGYLEVIIKSSSNGDQLGHLFWEDKLHYS